MARHLRQIIDIIDRHLAARFGRADGSVVPMKSEGALPPAVKFAFLQGEASLRKRFFQALDEMAIKDPESAVFLYEKLIEDRRFETLVCERSQLNKYGRSLIPHLPATDYAERCHVLLCSLMHDMEANGEDEKAFRLVELFVRHFAPTIAKPVQPKTLEEKKARLVQLYRQKAGSRFEIRESFVKEGEEMVFRLLAVHSPRDQIAIHETRAKSLKNARDRAYREAIEKLECPNNYA